MDNFWTELYFVLLSTPWRVLLFYPFVNMKGLIKMKKTIKSTAAVLLAIVCLMSLAACGGSVSETDVWKNAVYSEDTQLGEGEKTLVVEVAAEEKTVTFTVKTDEKIVGDALAEHNLISGEEGEYGLYVKEVNGITADYDVDKSYWAFYVDGEYATAGVDATEIDESVTYKLEYTKE